MESLERARTWPAGPSAFLIFRKSIIVPTIKIFPCVLAAIVAPRSYRYWPNTIVPLVTIMPSVWNAQHPLNHIIPQNELAARPPWPPIPLHLPLIHHFEPLNKQTTPQKTVRHSCHPITRWANTKYQWNLGVWNA